MSLGFARAMRDRFTLRLSRKTKVKRLRGINNEDFYKVAGSQAGLEGKTVPEDSGCEKNTNAFGTRTVAWKRILTTERRQAKAREETAYRYSVAATEKGSGNDSYFARRDSCQKWNTKTGKEINWPFEPTCECKRLYT